MKFIAEEISGDEEFVRYRIWVFTHMIGKVEIKKSVHDDLKYRDKYALKDYLLCAVWDKSTIEIKE